MEKNIGPFKLYTKKPNDITCGYLYTMDVILPVPNCKRRTVRVYLPKGYNKKNRYPVMYMTDGQNIVDKYTTAFGAWDIDVHEKELILEGYPSFIVVGIDCPRVGHIYRVKEYTLQEVNISKRYAGKRYGEEPYSDLLMDYIVNTLKPLIDQTFPTIPDKEHTAFGGSSMGGLAAFNYGTKCKDIFGFSLCFSPAFHLFEKEELYQYVDSLNINPEEYGKFYFYTGGVDFEGLFLKPTKDMYQYFLDHGFSKDQVALCIDLKQAHCEAAWSLHFSEAMKFWLKDL